MRERYRERPFSMLCLYVSVSVSPCRMYRSVLYVWMESYEYILHNTQFFHTLHSVRTSVLGGDTSIHAHIYILEETLV